MTQSIEIATFVDGIGAAVLDVQYNYLPAVIGANSDWDSRNHIEIVEASLWQKGEKLDVDIDLNQVYPVVSARLQEVEMEQAFEEEEGGF
ncbi:hypothetical protein KASHIRA_02760 [Serratia phage vB_SmaM-Kashira]|nr:hypothetical protein KASHIRA_02760 [Serratia phage vB_SmaM-Kashira]